MKAFIYTKDKDSRKIMEIRDIKSVYEDKKNHKITFYQGEDENEISVNTTYYKSTIYQN